MQRFAPVLRRSFQTARILAAEEAAATATKHEELMLTLAVPDKPLIVSQAVKRVTVPGEEGYFGVSKNQPPTLAQLKPGVVTVEPVEGENEKFFIPGGFAFVHANNVLDISSPIGVHLDDIDVDELKSQYAAATAARDAAESGSKEEAKAIVSVETFKSMAHALNVTL
jgi:F0F1-type ATP synthase epsilon subunit